MKRALTVLLALCLLLTALAGYGEGLTPVGSESVDAPVPEVEYGLGEDEAAREQLLLEEETEEQIRVDMLYPQSSPEQEVGAESQEVMQINGQYNGHTYPKNSSYALFKR